MLYYRYDLHIFILLDAYCELSQGQNSHDPFYASKSFFIISLSSWVLKSEEPEINLFL